jgi:hypothetical protein
MAFTVFVCTVGRKALTPLNLFESMTERRLRKLQAQLAGVNETDFMKDVIRAIRELSDLRKKMIKLEILEKYAQHTSDCEYINDLVDKDGSVLAKGQPCTCGFLEFQAEMEKEG